MKCRKCQSLSFVNRLLKGQSHYESQFAPDRRWWFRLFYQIYWIKFANRNYGEFRVNIEADQEQHGCKTVHQGSDVEKSKDSRKFHQLFAATTYVGNRRKLLEHSNSIV